jgi:hypothetical protein
VVAGVPGRPVKDRAQLYAAAADRRAALQDIARKTSLAAAQRSTRTPRG